MIITLKDTLDSYYHPMVSNLQQSELTYRTMNYKISHRDTIYMSTCTYKHLHDDPEETLPIMGKQVKWENPPLKEH